MRKKSPTRLMRCMVSAIALIVALGACGVVTAPGQNGRTPQQVLDDAAKALTAARSYHVNSKTQNGLTVDTADFDIEGTTANGTFSEDDVWTLHVTVVGNTLYVAGRSYWANQAQQGITTDVADQIGDRCVKVTNYNADAQNVINQFKRYTDTAGYAKSIQSPEGDMSVDGGTTFQGQAAISITDATATVFISAGNPSYPLHIDKNFGTDLGYTNFTKFNQLTAPIQPQQDCYDFATLANGGSPPASPDAGGSPPAPTDSPQVSMVPPTMEPPSSPQITMAPPTMASPGAPQITMAP